MSAAPRSSLRAPLLAAGIALLPLLAGCNSNNPNIRPVAEDEYQDPRTKGGEQGRMLGDQGLVFGIGKGANGPSQDGAALGVNAYLWRAALDTLSFMPLQSADPFGGVIITDWYQPPSSSGERFKATAYILGRQLRADGVKVSLFRQVMQGNQWVDAAVSPVTTSDIENKVLARARELRSQTAAQ
jgi:hypothetical protein